MNALILFLVIAGGAPQEATSRPASAPSAVAGPERVEAARRRGADGVPALLALLDDADPAVESAALEALTASGAPAVAAMRQHFAELERSLAALVADANAPDRESFERRADVALGWLGVHDVPASFPLLVAALDSPRSARRKVSERALMKAHLSATADLARERLGERDHAEFFYRVLGRNGDPADRLCGLEAWKRSGADPRVLEALERLSVSTARWLALPQTPAGYRGASYTLELVNHATGKKLRQKVTSSSDRPSAAFIHGITLESPLAEALLAPAIHTFARVEGAGGTLRIRRAAPGRFQFGIGNADGRVWFGRCDMEVASLTVKLDARGVPSEEICHDAQDREVGRLRYEEFHAEGGHASPRRVVVATANDILTAEYHLGSDGLMHLASAKLERRDPAAPGKGWQLLSEARAGKLEPAVR